MSKVYYDADADMGALSSQKIAIVGYGAQGRAHALNLRDSGLEVIVAELEGTPNWEQAQQDGIAAHSAAEAAEAADVVMMLVQDQVAAKVFENEIRAGLKPGNMLMFAHGFNIHYGQVIPPKDVDVTMVAPKGPGSLVREQYVKGAGVPCLYAIHQDATGEAEVKTLAYAKGLGATRAGVLQTTYKEETETDLFGEQAVLCGGVTELIKQGFEVLVAAGYQPEIAYFECCHEMKLIVDLIYKQGFTGMRQVVSDTAEYGDLTRGPRVIGPESRAAMEKILKDVQTGAFAREWLLENMVNRPMFSKLRDMGAAHQIEQVGAELRAMMPWLVRSSRAISNRGRPSAPAASRATAEMSTRSSVSRSTQYV